MYLLENAQLDWPKEVVEFPQCDILTVEILQKREKQEYSSCNSKVSSQR